MKLSDLLINKRKELDWTLSTASERTGISASYLSDIEHDRPVRMKMDTLQKISNAYGINYDEILVAAERIPPDVYWKIVRNPDLLSIIRSYEV